MVKSTKFFHGKRPPKKKSPCFCLVAIVLDFVCKVKKKDDKYYPHIYLEECKLEEKKAKKKHIKEKIVINDSDKSDESDDESTK